MKIRDILAAKGSSVVTVPPSASVLQAMAELVKHNIGAVVVVDDAIRGILSERDLLRVAAADVRRLETAIVRDVMTRNIITASPEAEISAVMDLMTSRRFRHLPVVDGADRLVGIITIGDVVNALRQSVEAENRHLHAYIHGVPA
ncbi:MAG TPA: CBS domain-containing protein [Longimicrobiales bacterium]|nr:CBS domain-containing protein [Longimicrobiales bacterium]